MTQRCRASRHTLQPSPGRLLLRHTHVKVSLYFKFYCRHCKPPPCCAVKCTAAQHVEQHERTIAVALAAAVSAVAAAAAAASLSAVIRWRGPTAAAAARTWPTWRTWRTCRAWRTWRTAPQTHL